MDVYEITGYKTGVSDAGVNYLQPSDSFQNIVNGFVHRQVLQSRGGFGFFAPRLIGQTRVMGIFEHTLPDSSTELLVFDTNFLYKYNTATRVFDFIPFGGTMGGLAYLGFNITEKDFYISGTSYPAAQFLSGGAANPAYTAANQGARFVFTCPGITPNAAGSQIFFYNGTDVRDFTSLADNPNYSPPLEGQLTNANYVLWFNERLNFVAPTIAGIEYNQGVLYSGVRTSDGNGDKFDVAGSGLFQADTFQFITGATILGQFIVLNFNRMAYTLEKTRDTFNPYFGRQVPGVLGTNAKFSPVAWNDVVKSLGKTGILACDGRRNLRIDNKIPFFTQDDIDQKQFNMTYGGFDRTNNQFLWSYKNSESELETQDRVLVNNYEEDTWSVYECRFTVFGQSEIGVDLVWDDIDETSGDPSWARWDTTEDLWGKIGLGESVQKTLAGDDFGFIYELNKDFNDYVSTITSFAQSTTTFLVCDTVALMPGDLVTISNVEGMTEINNYDTETSQLTGNLYTVLSTNSADPTLIEINVDSTLFSPYTSGGTITKIIPFYAETIPFNPYRSQGFRCYVSHVEFLLETQGGFLRVDVFADEQESPFIQDVLIQPDLINQSSQWVSMTVNQEANFLTFALKQASPSVQMRLTNMRIHCAPGGPTSD